MKKTLWARWFVAVLLVGGLAACSPKEVLKSAILKTTTALGLRQETSDEDFTAEMENLDF